MLTAACLFGHAVGTIDSLTPAFAERRPLTKYNGRGQSAVGTFQVPPRQSFQFCRCHLQNSGKQTGLEDLPSRAAARFSSPRSICSRFPRSRHLNLFFYFFFFFFIFIPDCFQPPFPSYSRAIIAHRQKRNTRNYAVIPASADPDGDNPEALPFAVYSRREPRLRCPSERGDLLCRNGDCAGPGRPPSGAEPVGRSAGCPPFPSGGERSRKKPPAPPPARPGQAFGVRVR